MYVCMSVCLRITWKWLQRSFPDFQGSSRGTLGIILGAKNSGWAQERGPENFYLLH